MTAGRLTSISVGLETDVPYSSTRAVRLQARIKQRLVQQARNEGLFLSGRRWRRRGWLASLDHFRSARIRLPLALDPLPRWRNLFWHVYLLLGILRRLRWWRLGLTCLYLLRPRQRRFPPPCMSRSQAPVRLGTHCHPTSIASFGAISLYLAACRRERERAAQRPLRRCR